MSNRAPAFQFYAGDWLSSTRIALMTAEQERGYLRLLCHCWNDPTCTLPDDDDVLARLSLMNEGWFNGGSALVRGCFEPKLNQPGRIHNTRLSEVRDIQTQWREKSKIGGIRSGEARRKAKGGSTTLGTKPPTKCEPNGNSPVSSLQSSIIPPIVPQKAESDLESFNRLVKRWNGIDGVPRCLEATPSRVKTFKTRMATKGWKDKVVDALAALNTSQFCKGNNDRNWKMNIDFFLKPDTVTKLVEGSYQGGNGNGHIIEDDFIPNDPRYKSTVPKYAGE